MVTDASSILLQPVVWRVMRRDVRPQLTVLSGQLIAGVGNLAFAVLMVRLLRPAEYASMATFLALFVVIALPATALTAAGALAPERLARLAPAMTLGAAAAGAAIAAFGAPLGRLLGLSAALVVALGIAVPGSVLLNLERGVAYGRQEHRRVTVSLLLEPAVRLVTGTVLGLTFGAGGAATGIVLGGYAALAAILIGRRPIGSEASSPAGRMAVSPAAVCSAGAAFLGPAALQTIDLVAANRVLAAPAAAGFAVLSTIGGAAFFATATIPLVLMPVAALPHAARTAAAMTAAIGLAIAICGGLAARPVLHHAFGAEYDGIAHLVGPYLLAMALLGLVRVQIAGRAATGRARHRTVVITLVAVAVEIAAITLWARSVEAVVATTLFTTAGLATVLELPALTPLATRVRRPAARAVAAMLGLCAVAAAARVATNRGLWVDEAISVNQAGLPFGEMLHQLTSTDVHPPLHHAVLWVTVRMLGTSEFAVRLPSLLAGVALVPALYWVGSVIYDKRTGWVAALLAALAPFTVWYSQEARMYAIFMLLATLAIGAQIQAIRLGRTVWWVAYWSHHRPSPVDPVLRHPARARPAGRRRLGGLAASPPTAAPTRPAARLAHLVRSGAPHCHPDAAAPARADRAYGQRGDALVPGQAGADSSSISGGISIYAVAANFIWAMFGYHADAAMVQIAALWPLLMLLALVMLGRGRSGRSVLLMGLVLVPMVALFAVGTIKRDLFELRYFSGAVPAMLLLVARIVTSTTVRRFATVIVTSVLAAVMLAGLVDQQINGANPRVYDFEGAFDRIAEHAEPGDVVLYEPVYLTTVAEYYAPAHRRPAGGFHDPGRCGRLGRRHRARGQRRGHGRSPRHRARHPPNRPCTRRLVRTAQRAGVGAAVNPTDERLAMPAWEADTLTGRARRRAVALALATTCGLVFYFGWLLQPGRVGNPVLFGVLVTAELFNVVQAGGFWWTCLGGRRRPPRRSTHSGEVARLASVDVFIPTYSEPIEVVEVTIVAATQLRGADVRIALLDDGDRDEMERLAARHRIRYIRRARPRGPRRATSTTPSRSRTPSSCSSWTATTYPVRSCSNACCRGSPIRPSPTCRALSITPTASAIAWPAQLGGSRRSSSDRSPAARMPTARCSAAAPTSPSGALLWSRPVASRPGH